MWDSVNEPCIPGENMGRLKLVELSLILGFSISQIASCGKRPNDIPTAPVRSSANSSVTGVIPSSPDKPAASDREGAPAIGAIEAGQAAGGSKIGGAPAPTGGDGAPASASRASPAGG